MRIWLLFLLNFYLSYTKLPSYNIDRSKITVSGLSSGGAMSVQFHVAFSSIVKGAAVFAGIPYFCAQSNPAIATTTCMISPALIPLEALILEAKTLAATDWIDSLENLEESKVFLFSGTKDTVVYQGVMDNLFLMYEKLGANITKNFDIPAEHSFPTDNFGNLCDTLSEPYINNCNYNGAYEALKVLYGEINSPIASKGENLKEFDQDYYFEYGSSLNSVGYLYIPDACQKGEKCGLHVSFHGCQQTIDDIGLDFVTKIGLNELAEANNLIILYPQVERSDIYPLNPEGCWDWWGYSDTALTLNHYVTREGTQMSAIYEMIKDLGANFELLQQI